MPFCPKCKSEFREGFKICSDCGIELVSNIEKEDEKNQNELEDFIFLVNVSDGYEINFLESLLKANDITYLKKYKEAGEYLKIGLGMTSYGIDIFVLKSQILKAKELLEELELNKTNNEINEEEISNEEKYTKKRSLYMWVIIGLFFVPGLLFLLYNLFNNIYKIIFGY